MTDKITGKEFLEVVSEDKLPLNITLGQFLREIVRNDKFDVTVKDENFNDIFSVRTERKIYFKQYRPINLQEALSCRIANLVEYDFQDKEFFAFIDYRLCRAK